MAVELYLEFANADTLVGQEREEWRVRVLTEDLERPEQPEPLKLLYEMQRFNTMFNEGAYSDQFEIMMMEFHTCIEAELTYSNRMRSNREAAMEALAKVNDGATGQQLG